jgi:hypothetical protein
MQISGIPIYEFLFSFNFPNYRVNDSHPNLDFSFVWLHFSLKIVQSFLQIDLAFIDHSFLKKLSKVSSNR